MSVGLLVLYPVCPRMFANIGLSFLILYLKEALALFDNSLVGTIPSEIGLISRLGQFVRRHFVLVLLPCRPETCTHTCLPFGLSIQHTDRIYLYDNDLIGSIPSEIGLTRLSEFTHLYPILHSVQEGTSSHACLAF